MTSVRSGFAWIAFAQGSLFIVQFIVSVLVARLLSPYDMGIFALALSMVGLLSIIRSFGLGSYLVRASEWTPPLVATIFTINTLIAITVSLLIAGFSVLGGAMVSESGVRHLLLIMAIPPLFSIFDFLPAAGIERHAEFRTIAIVNIVRFSTANVATLILAYLGFSYMSLGYGQIIGSVAGLILNNIFGHRYSSFRLGLDDWRQVTRHGIQILLSSGIGMLSGRVSDVVLAKMLGLPALGLYSRAGSLTGVLWENLHVIIVRVLFVDFASQRREGLSLRGSYLRLTQVLTGALWPILVGMAVVSGPIVVTLFGDAWLGTTVPLQLLAVATAACIPIIMAWDVFIICNETGKQMRIELNRAIVKLSLLFVGCLIGLNAVAALAIVSSLFSVAIYRPHLERLTDTRWADYVPIYRTSLILTVVAVLPVSIVMATHKWSAYTPLPLVFAGVMLGVLAWIVALLAFRHPLYEEGRRLLVHLSARLRIMTSGQRVGA